MKSRIPLLSCMALLSISIGCSFATGRPGAPDRQSSETAFAGSGTIILSRAIPQKPTNAAAAARMELASRSGETDPVKPQLMAPLIGYFPPAHSYIPADNETWLEINSEAKKLAVYKGKTLVKEIQAEGSVPIGPGEFYLQYKQKQPLWYATDRYFEKRKLAIPRPGDRLRFRRGALGKYALYPTTTFPIHCAPIWTEDVGGLRISAADLSSIYYMLPLGAPIVVK